MRSIMTIAPGECRVVAEDEPEVAAGHIKVRLRHCSVLMENVGQYTGTDPRLHRAGNPLYRGYPLYQAGEVLAEVVEVGAGVDDVQVGDRYAGYTAYREITAVTPDSLTRVDPGVPAEAAISQAFSGTTLQAVRRSKLRIGDDVLIIGAGPMGALLAPWVRIAGAGRIIVADLHQRRRDIALELGATHVLDPASVDVAEAVQDLTDGNGADIVFDAGNTAATFPLALELARPQGRVVVLSWHTQPVTIDDITKDFYHKELDIIATRATGPAPSYRSPYLRWTSDESQRLIARWMAEKRFNPAPIVTGRRPVAEFVDAMEDLRTKPANHLKTLIDW